MSWIFSIIVKSKEKEHRRGSMGRLLPMPGSKNHYTGKKTG
jgi:hypothetical protein